MGRGPKGGRSMAPWGCFLASQVHPSCWRVCDSNDARDDALASGPLL